MNQQNQSNHNIQNELISEYEAMSQKGTVGFYEETVFLALIEYYQNSELFGKAIEVADHAITQHAYSSTFHKKKAQILLEKGCASQALTCLDQAELFNPSEFEIILLRVESLNMLGYYEEAYAILDQLEAQATKAELSEIYLSKAILHESKQQFKDMFLALNKSILSNPGNIDALERIWFSVEMSRCFDQSVILHKKLIDIDPYNYVAWYNLGYSYAAINDYTNAANAFEYAYIIDNQFEFAYRDCAHACMQIGQYQRALECYKEALEFIKPDSDILLNIGYCLEKLNDFPKAKSSYLKATQLDSLNDFVYYRLGECYAKEQKWLSAIAAYEKAISIEDLKEEYFTALGTCYFRIMEYDTAKYYFQKATEIAPEIADCWIQYTLFLLKTGEPELALEVIEEAQFYSYGVELAYCKVNCLLSNNKRSEALRFLNDTLAENDFTTESIFTLLSDFTEDTDILSIISINKKN
jgi:tetratricopeptide (TPR) repeat protein